MRDKILILLVLSLLFLISLHTLAETPVIGFIAEDTIWTQADSPYVTLGNLIVKKNVSLTIEPGTTVKFGVDHSLTVEGTLIARGTEAQEIRFTSSEKQEPGAWVGIIFEQSAVDAKFDDSGNYIEGSILENSRVAHAETAVTIRSSAPFITRCATESNKAGIVVYEADGLRIQSNTMSDNSGVGIDIRDSQNVMVYKNSVLRNKGYHYSSSVLGGGITLWGNTNIVIEGNTISHNGPQAWQTGKGGGVFVSGNATIRNNVITSNTLTGKYAYGGGIFVNGHGAIITGNTVTGNIIETSYHGYGGGIFVQSSNATISENIISENISFSQVTKNYIECNGGGIYISGGESTIENNLLRTNQADMGAGIYASGAVSINHNVIIANRGLYGVGIYFMSKPPAEVIGNEIRNNEPEVYQNSESVYISGQPIFSGNTITENGTSYALWYGESVDSPNLNATNNYWGVTTEPQIRVLIYDFFANDARAIVDVVPFLTENPFGTPPIDSEPPVAPTGLSPTTDLVNTRTPTLTWSTSEIVVSCILQIASDSQFSNLVVEQQGIAGSDYDIPNNALGDMSTYYWRVKAVNTAGESDWSEVGVFKIVTELPRWDVNADGVVDISDLVLVGSHFGDDYLTIQATATLSDAGTFSGEVATVRLIPRNTIAADGLRWLKIDLATDWIGNLYGIQFDLHFDPDVLHVVGSNSGDVLAQDGAQTYWNVSETDNQTGTITDAVYVRKATKQDVDVRGTLASFIFEVKETNVLGGTQLSLSNVKLADARARRIWPITEVAVLDWQKIFVPPQSKLLPNYPNPFNPETWLPYQLDQDSDVIIHVYDAQGQLVRILKLGQERAGFYLSKDRAAYWDGRNDHGEPVSSGLYYYSLQTKDFQSIRKMTLVK